MKSAILGGAQLKNAILGNAHLEDADLRDAHLEDADLRDAHLEGANLTGVVGVPFGAGETPVPPHEPDEGPDPPP